MSVASPEMMEFLKALASESRLQILMLFMDGRERTVNEVVAEVGLGQSTCSEHLSLLKRAGVMQSRKEGKEVIYQPNRGLIVERLKTLTGFLQSCC